MRKQQHRTGTGPDGPDRDDEMLYVKACPRCQGDVELGSDMYGRYLACLQCGYMIDSREEALAALKLAAARTKAA